MKDMPWHRTMGNIRIDRVKVGPRRREEMDDIDALARSIEENGLLHPIVLDVWENLIAGHRRLEACKKLGWEAIPYREIGEVNEQKLREIELRENLDRKDFTELELSKNMAELIAIVGERLKEEFRAEPAQNQDSNFCPNPGQKLPVGRPTGSGKPDGIRAIAKEIGVPRQTVHDAIAHVEAVKKYPILESVPKGKAINIARSAKEKPPFERQQYVEDRAEMERMLAREFRQADRQVDEDAKRATALEKAVSAVCLVKVDREAVEAWIRATDMSRTELDMHYSNIKDSIDRLQQIEALLRECTKLRILRKEPWFYEIE